VSLAECDVANKKDLESFRNLRGNLEHLFSGDRTHGITQQIHRFLEIQHDYKILIEIRRLAKERGYKSAARNGTLGRLLDAGFVHLQTLAVRKLVDESRGVISLNRILLKIREKRELFTRENYVCWDGVPFEYEELEAKFYSDWFQSGSESIVRPTRDPKENFFLSQTRHKIFDQLSGVPEKFRKRSDTLSESYIKEIKGELKKQVVQKVKRTADKHVAHAADRRSDNYNEDVENGVRLSDLDKIADHLKEATKLIGHVLGYASLQHTAIRQYDILWCLEYPYLPGEVQDQVRDKINSMED
jgi:hypothetical protein